MKYLKLYENMKINEPKIGDYVVVDFDKKNKITDELEKIIGIVIDYTDNLYRVKYGTTDWMINKNEIEKFSKNKEDLEYLIQSKKYNL